MPTIKGKRKVSLGELGPLTRHCTTESQTLIPVTLSWSQRQLHVDAFIDSGAVECFIDAQWAKKHCIPTLHLTQTLTVTALDGRALGSGIISKVTEPLVYAHSFEGHTERITFLLVDSPVYPLVLGHTWLVQHNPHIKWGGGRPILQWASRCNLRGHSTPSYVQSTLPIRTDPISESDSEEALSHGSQRSSSVCSESGGESLEWDSAGEGFIADEWSVSDIQWSPPSSPRSQLAGASLAGIIEFPLPPNVPVEYSGFAEVFSKQKAASLPPHRPYDCAIELYPGTSRTRGSLYSLSAPESAAMRNILRSP